MKFYTTMPVKLRPFFKDELTAAEICIFHKRVNDAWRHLERAHIIGQKYPYHHTLVHWKMLQFGIKIKNGKEITSQIPRLIFGGVKSFIGHIPTGNTGGSNVPPLQKLPIPDELRLIINQNS